MLGVDLGTSHTVAMLRWADGRVRPLLFDGRPLLPSAVYRDAAGRLHVGQDAVRLGYADPARLEPNPKRHVDAASVLLGDAEVPVPEAFAALLDAVAREAVATVGELPPAVVTYPAAWGAGRRDVLVQALALAGWPSSTQLVPEPVAAARYFAEVLRRPVPVGAALAVFDFGGGTLDIAVVRNEGAGADGRARFEVVASGGLDDLGGLDIDAALVAHLGMTLATSEPAAWSALREPVTLAQWRARRQFWDDVRGAKEMLSRAAQAPVAVPGVEHAMHLTRDELEMVTAPLIRRGVAEAGAVVKAAGLTPADLAGLFLVGGSSRVPLVARLLHSELGVAPTVLEQPELPVAEGALLAAENAVEREAGAPGTSVERKPGTVGTSVERKPGTVGTPVEREAGATESKNVTPAAPLRAAAVEPLVDTMAHSGPATEPALHTEAAGPPTAAGSPPTAAGGTATAAGSPPTAAGGPAGGPPTGAATAAGGPLAATGAGKPGPFTEAFGPPTAAGGPPTAAAPPPGPARTEPEPQYGEPVDPWATGEAAALAAAHGEPFVPPTSGVPASPAPVSPSAEPWLASAHSADARAAHPAEGWAAHPAEGWAAHPAEGWAAHPADARAASAAEPWLASAQSADVRGADVRGADGRGADGRGGSGGGPRPVVEGGGKLPAYRRKGLWIVAAVTVVVLGIAATAAVLLWPGYSALDYQPLSEPRRVQSAVPVTSAFSAAALRADRAYFASADENGQLGVVAADAGSGATLWTSREAGAAPRWEFFFTLPHAVVAVTDTDSDTSSRRAVFLDPGTGRKLWERRIGSNDSLLFAGDIAVFVDRTESRVVGLKVRDGGKVEWEIRSPKSTYGQSATKVVTATTPDDLAGAATTGGVPFAEPEEDDQRLVQIGADRSARVVDARSGDVVAGPRQSVADPGDEAIAHNGRLIVAESGEARRIVAYDLGKMGEPRVPYTAPENSQLEHLTACGDDRVCFVQKAGYDSKSAQVVAVDVAKGGVLWSRAVAETDNLVPVGEAVLAAQNTSPRQVSLLDAGGAVKWTRAGAAGRLDGGNLLLFSKALSTSPDDPALSGEHVGDAAVPLGSLADVRSATCAWDQKHLACVAEQDFVLHTFAS